MTCDQSLARMMEADPHELRGEADTELAAHIRGCPRCARVAETLVAEVDAIDAVLEQYAAGPLHTGAAAEDGGAIDPNVAADVAADTAIDAVLARQGPGSETVPLHRAMPGAETGQVEPVPVRPPRSWIRRAWVPLTAAATLALVLMLPGDDPLPTNGSDPTAVAPIDPRVAVTPPADRNAAIMETENPNITIVWLYQREGT